MNKRQCKKYQKVIALIGRLGFTAKEAAQGFALLERSLPKVADALRGMERLVESTRALRDIKIS